MSGSRPRRWAPAFAPLVAAGAVAVVFGTHRALVLVAVAVVVFGLIAVGVDVARGLDRAVAAVAAGLRVVTGGFLFVFAVIPAWGWSTVRRRDPFARRSRTETNWRTTTHAPTSAERLGTGSYRPTARRSLVGRFTWGLGCVLLLLGANYGLGYGWDRAFPTRISAAAQRAASVTGINIKTHHDPRADLPSMAQYPWRERYFRDIQRQQGNYWPYTEYRPRPFRSPYVNMTGWERLSYQPKTGSSPRPDVWMFGGSTTWGEGQRDRYTIASWISRLAERDGLPIRIHNFGERGWTHFQEMILYEQLLAAKPDPAFSVFYDGANEITAQSLLDEAVPTHTLAYTYAQRLGFGAIGTDLLQQEKGPDVGADLYTAYSKHSAIHKIARWLAPARAGASPAQTDGDGTDPSAPGANQGFTPGQDPRANGQIYAYNLTDQDGRDAAAVYGRGIRLTSELSREHGVRQFLFWQPVLGWNFSPQRAARARLPKASIDISDTLKDHSDVYIDGGHTNEEGARLVAVQIWKHIKPAVAKWHEEHR